MYRDKCTVVLVGVGEVLIVTGRRNTEVNGERGGGAVLWPGLVRNWGLLKDSVASVIHPCKDEEQMKLFASTRVDGDGVDPARS